MYKAFLLTIIILFAIVLVSFLPSDLICDCLKSGPNYSPSMILVRLGCTFICKTGTCLSGPGAILSPGGTTLLTACPGIILVWLRAEPVQVG